MNNGKLDLNQLERELAEAIRNERFLTIHTSTYFQTYKNIYLVNGSVIGKRQQGRIKNEYEIGKYLFENEINVPEQYGVIDLDKEQGVILMQRINGFNLILEWIKMARITDPKRVEGLWLEELRKARALGLVPGDDILHMNNSLYSPGEDKVYLIDFEFWRSGTAF